MYRNRHDVYASSFSGARAPWNSADSVRYKTDVESPEPGKLEGRHWTGGKTQQENIQCCLNCRHEVGRDFDPCAHCDGHGSVTYSYNYRENQETAGRAAALARRYPEYPVCECVHLGISESQFYRLRRIFA